MRVVIAAVVLFLCWLSAAGAQAQMLSPVTPQTAQTGNPLTDPQLSPGVEFLYHLDAQFAAATLKGGGKAFSAWFAPDAVTLAEGKAPVMGHDAIAAAATWTPESYQLTWTAEGARMSPEGDMGFTWGHYQGLSKDSEGNPVKTSGRYLTVWKRQPDGEWKVALDASNEGPPDDCCRVR